MFLAVLAAIILVYLLSSIRLLAGHERALLVRLGYLMDAVKGPGPVLAFAPVDRILRVDLRRDPLELPPPLASASDAVREHIVNLLKSEQAKVRNTR